MFKPRIGLWGLTVLLVVSFLTLAIIACSETTLHHDWPHGSSDYRPDAPPAITLFAPRNELNANATSYEFIWQSSLDYTTTLYLSFDPSLSEPFYEKGFDAATRVVHTPEAFLPLVSEHAGTNLNKKFVYWAVKGVRAGERERIETWSQTNLINPELDPLSIVISEVCYRATKSDTTQGYYDGDFIELYNATTDRTIDIGGWTIENHACNFTNHLDDFKIPDGVRLAPGGFWVIANTSSQFDNAFDTSAFVVRRVKLDIATGKGFALLLKDKDGIVRDGLNVVASKFGGSGATTPYWSAERTLPISDGTNESAAWKAAIGGVNVRPGFQLYTYATPGARNSIWPEQ